MAAGLLFTVADPDLWGHVRFGMDILDSGWVQTGPDPYSFTADRPFIYHEWLGATIMAVAYQAAGPPGLQLLKAVLGAALFALLWTDLRRAPFAWRWGGLAFAAVGVLPMLPAVRPQLWSALGVVVLLRLLLSPVPRALLAVPPLFAVWANLHGGWIVGGAILAVLTLGAFLERNARRWRLLLTGIASLLGTLVTPYGVTLWTFLADTVRFSRSDVSEWLPIWRSDWISVALWIATGSLVIATHRRRNLPTLTLVVLALLAYMGAAVVRVEPLFIVATVAMLSREWHGSETPVPSHVARSVLDGLAVVAAIIGLNVTRGPATCIVMRGSFAPDTVAAESLRGASGRLVTFFDWGEYALWQFGPLLQVSLDGRREAIYSEATLRAQQEVALGTTLGMDTLAQMRADYVWLPSGSPARTWLQSHGYRVDIASDRSFVARRADHPPLDAWQGMSSGCFPGP